MPLMVSDLKMTRFQSTGRRPRRDAEHGDLAAHDHVIDHLVEGFGRARHFKADIEALLHVEVGP